MKAKVVWAIVAVIVITATAVVVSNRVFSPQEAGALVITQIEIPGRFGIVGISGHDLESLAADYVPLCEAGEKIYASFNATKKPFDYDATATIVKQLGKEHWLVRDMTTGKLLVVYCDTPHALAEMSRGRPFLFGGYLVKESYKGYPTYQISPYTATPLDVPN
ncbi:MAG: hypothetical protein KGZ50_01970 [Peptococcaceae bacterium]|nr:hypothetical protein [Peptococcaceae bacterium]